MLGFARKFDYPPASLPMTQWDDGYDGVAKPFDLEGITVGIVEQMGTLTIVSENVPGARAAVLFVFLLAVLLVAPRGIYLGKAAVA